MKKNYLCQWKCHINVVKGANYSFLVGPLTAGVGGDSLVSFCWVCAAGFSEPLPHFSKIQLVVYYQCCVLIC